MRTLKRSADQWRQTEETRTKVFDFMRQFHARQMWTMNGPMDTEVDEIICFAWFKPQANEHGQHENMGIALVQTWIGGGWSIFTEPTSHPEIGETAAAMIRNRASQAMLYALTVTHPHIDHEIEQRKHGGNDEDWRGLALVSDYIHGAIRQAGGEPPPTTDYRALFNRAMDIIARNSDAWGDEEASVRDEHAELIAETDAFYEEVKCHAF